MSTAGKCHVSGVDFISSSIETWCQQQFLVRTGKGDAKEGVEILEIELIQIHEEQKKKKKNQFIQMCAF